MYRYQKQSITVERDVFVEAVCDRCGWGTPNQHQLIAVVVAVHQGEEGGSYDELDYCDKCLVALAPALVAAGSKATLVTGEHG